MTERIKDELSPKQFERQMVNLQGPINSTRVVAWNAICDHDAALRADFKRCSDYAATLGIENEQLHTHVKKRDAIIESLRWNYKHEVNRVREFGEKLEWANDIGDMNRDKYNALRDAVPVIVREEILAHSGIKYPDEFNDKINRRLRELTEGGGDSCGDGAGIQRSEQADQSALDCTACSGKGECWSTLVNKPVPCPYCEGTGKEPKE